MNPYIGITDFMHAAQVREMLDVFNMHLPRGSKHKLHVGVMMSYKTLHGIPSKWSKAFPPKDAIESIFFSDATYNCLHYADYDNSPGLWRSISDAIGYCGIGLDALQLDMPWPDPGEVAHGVHTSRRRIEVILQIGSEALIEVGSDPNKLIEKLRDYDGVIHRVLLDKSGGKGLGMDAQGLIPFVEALREHHSKLGVTVAGGLGPETLHLVEPLVSRFPELSIDAQGRLRRSGSAIDPIDWDLAAKYLIRALRLFH